MKRIVAAFAFCFVLIISKANPIFLPQVYMDHFFFEGNQKWKILINTNCKVDSLLISSSTGKSRCKINSGSNYGYTFTNNDSLYSEMAINSLGDSVTIFTYYQNYNHKPDSTLETFVFGNYPNATLPAPSAGQMIIRFLPNIMDSNYHCIRDSLGRTNGLLFGKIYDNKNQLLTSGSINISPFPTYVQCLDGGYEISGIDINEDGFYSTSLYSMIYNLSNINNCSKHKFSNTCFNYHITNSLEIEPMNFIIVPDTIIEMDIHLIDEYVGINTFKANTAELIRIFPNPITNNQLQYEITTPVRSTNSCIIIYNLQGQKLCQFPINENKGSIELPSNISNGNYLLQLWMNNKAYGSEQFNVIR